MAAGQAAAEGKNLRIIFRDEARFGRLPVMRAAWAPKGVRPKIKAAIEREFRYVYGAISPVEGELDWMCSESMNTENMNRFLAQIGSAHPDDRILMVLDGASSHKSSTLKIPGNMTLLGLPPYSPELNPVENLWDHVREKGCANRFFKTLDEVICRVDQELHSLSQCAKTVAGMFCRPYLLMAI